MFAILGELYHIKGIQDMVNNFLTEMVDTGSYPLWVVRAIHHTDFKSADLNDLVRRLHFNCEKGTCELKGTLTKCIWCNQVPEPDKHCISPKRQCSLEAVGDEDDVLEQYRQVGQFETTLTTALQHMCTKCDAVIRCPLTKKEVQILVRKRVRDEQQRLRRPLSEDEMDDLELYPLQSMALT